MKFIKILVLLFFGIYRLHAQDTTSKEVGDFELMVYGDVYYAWDSNEPIDNQKQYVTQAVRHNEFNINLAALKVAYDTHIIRSNITIQTGTYPITNYAEPNPLGQIINEANIGVKIGENTWIDMGVMSGHFGYESAFSLDNELYTQALVTEYTPYYQTGIQFSTQFRENIAFRAVVVNGWQNIFEAEPIPGTGFNTAKSFGLAVDYSLNEKLSFGYGNYFGNEGNETTGKKYRFHNNLIGQYVGNSFSSILSLDLTAQELLTSNKNSTVLFITWINKFDLTDYLSIGARYEYVADPDQILFTTIAPGFQTNIITASLNYYSTKNSVFKIELKQYYGEENIWTTGKDIEDANNNFMINAGLAIRINHFSHDDQYDM